MSDRRTHVTKDREGTPRWVKVFGAAALIVVVVFVILILTGRGGDHGPGRHTASASTLGAQTQR